MIAVVLDNAKKRVDGSGCECGVVEGQKWQDESQKEARVEGKSCRFNVDGGQESGATKSGDLS